MPGKIVQMSSFSWLRVNCCWPLTQLFYFGADGSGTDPACFAIFAPRCASVESWNHPSPFLVFKNQKKKQIPDSQTPDFSSLPGRHAAELRTEEDNETFFLKGTNMKKIKYKVVPPPPVMFVGL